jgi:hypothetical protein
MGELILGIAAAIGASTLYSLGVALQALDARQTPHHEYLRVGLARNLIKRRRWLLGTGLSMLGWPLQLLALSLAPLVVVQPAMAAGLLVLLLVGERMLGERAGRREHLAVSAIVLGVVGAALCAPPNTTTQAPDDAIAIVLGALGLASLLPYMMLMLRRSHRPPAALVMSGAGLAFGWSGVATKLASDNLAYGSLLIALAWGLATAGASAIAALSEMSALQSRPAIQVAPVVFVIQTAVPVALAPVLFGEHFTETPLSGALLAGSLAVLIAGAAVLARSPLLLALMEGEQPEEEALTGDAPEDAREELVSAASDSVESPSPPSQETMRSVPRTDATDPSTATTKTSPARVRR